MSEARRHLDDEMGASETGSLPEEGERETDGEGRDRGRSDHGFVRAVYNNFHDLGGGMYRLSQPSPAQIRAYHQRLGIRTIVNLRGDHGYGSYAMEVETCRALGIRLVDHRLYSRQPPTVEVIDETRELFDRFARIMAPDGYLYIGHSESIQDTNDRFELVGRTIYRLRTAER